MAGPTQSIPDDLANKAIEAITLALRDLQNQKELYRTDVTTVSISFEDGSTYDGPTMREILRLAQTSDISAVGALGTEVLKNKAEVEAARDAAVQAQAAAESVVSHVDDSAAKALASEQAAKASETNAKDARTGAETAEKNAQTAETGAKAAQAAAAGSQSTASTAAAAAKTSETNAATSAAAAKTSETNAANSATAAQLAETNANNAVSGIASSIAIAEGARDDALDYLNSANDARNEAEGFKNAAATSATEASQSAAAAAASVAQAQTANKFTNAISVGDAGDPDENVVDFVKTPTINGVPIVASAQSGEAHFHTDLTCTNSGSGVNNLNDPSWAGKTFMVQKPTVTGSASAPISSNNAPSGMVYPYALCTDFYAGWTPAGGAKGRQRVQMIYDQESIWIRGYHQESTTWTGWKRIATQLTTDVTGKDLNTLILTGNYAYTSALNAPKIDATEASIIYFLDVYSTDNGDDVHQSMHSPKTNSRFDRYRINGTWSQWWNTTATFDVDTAAAGVDLNTLTNPGWWGVPLDTARNLPTGTAYPPSKTGQGILEVAGISNGGTIQRLHYVDDGDAYYRYRPASTGTTPAAWGGWKVEARWDETRTLGVVNGGTGGTTPAAARAALSAAGTGANSFTGTQNIDGDIILAGSHSITAPGGMILPCRTNNALIRIAEYSGTGLDARYEVYVQNKADPTKRTNLLTMDVLDSNAPAAGTTDNTSGQISIAGKLTVSNTSVFNNTISTDGAPAGNYKISMLNNSPTAGGKNYLRKFRGASPDTIWHETVQGETYRLAAGSTDSSDVFVIDKNGQGNGGEIRFHGYQLRLVGSGASGSRGLFLRNDGGNSYFLLTDPDKGDDVLATGVSPWNNLRPLTISNEKGIVTFGHGIISSYARRMIANQYLWIGQYNEDVSASSAGTDAQTSRAAFFEEVSIPTGAGSEYHPLIKQRCHFPQTGGTVKHGSWSQGTLHPDLAWTLNFCPNGANPGYKNWTFKPDGTTALPGNLTVGNITSGTISCGNISSTGSISTKGGITVNAAGAGFSVSNPVAWNGKGAGAYFQGYNGGSRSWYIGKGGDDSTLSWLNDRVSGQMIQMQNSGGILLRGRSQAAGAAGGSNRDFVINPSGAITGPTGTIHAAPTSDSRFKTDIADTKEGALERILQIETKEFNWDHVGKENRRDRGYIAQQLQQVDPLYVWEDNSATDSSYKGILRVSENALIADLIDSVKALKADNEDLRKELAELKAAK